jgi:hypothetical protein
MSMPALSKHAAVRMAQRGIMPKDSELIVLIGTQVDDGYLVRDKDYQEVEHALKRFLKRVRRIVGKRLIISNGCIVTAYHSSKKQQRRLLRQARDGDHYW